MFSCASFTDFRYLINLRNNANIYILIVLFSVYLGIYSYPLKSVLPVIWKYIYFFLVPFCKINVQKIWLHYYKAIILLFTVLH